MEELCGVTLKLKNRRSHGIRDHDYIHIIFYLEYRKISRTKNHRAKKTYCNDSYKNFLPRFFAIPIKKKEIPVLSVNRTRNRTVSSRHQVYLLSLYFLNEGLKNDSRKYLTYFDED